MVCSETAYAAVFAIHSHYCIILHRYASMEIRSHTVQFDYRRTISA